MDDAARGQKALNDRNFELAIKEYTAAISKNPQAVDYFLKRSMAYQRSSKYEDALSDAENALRNAQQRAKRELIAETQFRRSIALFCTDRYGDAKAVLDHAEELGCKDKSIPVWKAKIKSKMDALGPDDARCKPTHDNLPYLPKDDPVERSSKESQATTEAKPKPVQKVTHDWYQNNENVFVTLLVKGLKKEEVTVDIEENSLYVSFPMTGSTDYQFSLEPLFAKSVPSESKFRVTPTKVEVTLRKDTPGVKWKALEGEAQAPNSVPSEATSTRPDAPTSTSLQSSAAKTGNERPPTYPTSSKKGAKDWDKVAKELTTTGAKSQVDDDDDGEGDEASKFFKQLYKGATPEQQRAMMKSYQESGGTVLSTDWSQVGNKKVTPEPPDGMEAKYY